MILEILSNSDHSNPRSQWLQTNLYLLIDVMRGGQVLQWSCCQSAVGVQPLWTQEALGALHWHNATAGTSSKFLPCTISYMTTDDVK